MYWWKRQRDLPDASALESARMTITARCAARIDLAGGTLDLWPLYLLHPGSVTINFAFALDMEARVSALPGTRVELVSHDFD